MSLRNKDYIRNEIMTSAMQPLFISNRLMEKYSHNTSINFIHCLEFDIFSVILWESVDAVFNIFPETTQFSLFLRPHLLRQFFLFCEGNESIKCQMSHVRHKFSIFKLLFSISFSLVLTGGGFSIESNIEPSKSILHFFVYEDLLTAESNKQNRCRGPRENLAISWLVQ